MQTEARKHLSKGLMKLIRQTPFYTSLVLSHKIIEDPGLDSFMATNGKNLIFNEKILQLPVSEMCEILKHEAMHIANQHHIRMAELEKTHMNKVKALGVSFRMTFNIAADLAINGILNDYWCWKDTTFIKDGCIPGRYPFQNYPKLQTTEFYFNQLLDEYESGELNDETASQMEAEDSHFLASEVQIDRKTDAKEQELQSQKAVAKAVLTHKQEQERDKDESHYQSRAAGRGDAIINKVLETFESDSDLDWRSELRNFFTQTTKDKYTYRRVNRRNHDNDLILPSKYNKQPKDIVFLVDTSGSMDDECVALVYDHIEEIIKVSPNTRLQVAHFDDVVFEDSIKEYTKSNIPINKEDRERVGCGGTQFKPALDYSSTQNASGCIMLTDMMPMDGNAFKNYKIKIPTLFVSVMKYQYANLDIESYCVEPDWANVVYVKKEKQ